MLKNDEQGNIRGRVWNMGFRGIHYLGVISGGWVVWFLINIAGGGDLN